MQIVLFGQKWLAVEVLRELPRLPGVEIVAVCPDTERDRLAAEARQRGIPVAGMSAVPACDMAVAACCQKYIPADVRARCGLGVLAYHPSLLPRHRGRDAVRWTIAMREPIAGGSVYWMDDGADTGPIEAQDWCHVPGRRRRGSVEAGACPYWRLPARSGRFTPGRGKEASGCAAG